MPFSRDTRERALGAAARHCCVCRRYKGVRVEVHHIVPAAAGGDDDFENAVVLCFDCHADAGHYNPGHPRGTKYSESELRRARDAWYRQVESGAIPEASAPDLLHFRYLICKDLSALGEIVTGDLARLPLTRPRLVKNAALDFLSDLVRQQAAANEGPGVPSDSYRTEADYVRAHPEAVHVSGMHGGLAYFDAVRVPTDLEFTERVAPYHPVTRILLDHGVDADRIGRATAYWEYCGEDRVEEIYHLRLFWGVFLCATNLSAYPVTLINMHASEVSGGVGIRSLRDTPADMVDVGLPRAPLGQGDTAVVPLATVLGPIGAVEQESGWFDRTELDHGQIQELTHVTRSAASVLGYDFLGPSYHPDSIRTQNGDGVFDQQIHALDLTNTYVLDRYFEMGCCPHLFARRRNGELVYLGELFARQPGSWQVEMVRVEPDWAGLYIAELEEETTEIASITRNGVLIFSHVTLSQGDVCPVAVTEGDTVRFVGRYLHTNASPRLSDPWRRNQLIVSFLDGARTFTPAENGV